MIWSTSSPNFSFLHAPFFFFNSGKILARLGLPGMAAAQCSPSALEGGSCSIMPIRRCRWARAGESGHATGGGGRLGWCRGRGVDGDGGGNGRWRRDPHQRGGGGLGSVGLEEEEGGAEGREEDDKVEREPSILDPIAQNLNEERFCYTRWQIYTFLSKIY